MSIFEYDEEETIRLIRQDEYRLGQENGMEQGVEQGIKTSLCNLMDTLKLTENQAMDALKIPTEERAFYMAEIQKK